MYILYVHVPCSLNGVSINFETVLSIPSEAACLFQFNSLLFQIKQTCLVEIFCELNLEVYDRAIGESISKLAFEAVEKIIQVQ